MGIRQDVFGLEQIYRLQLEGQWSIKGDVWLTPSPFRDSSFSYVEQPYGYAAAGEDRSVPYPYNNSNLDRIDFNNDTVTTSNRGNFSANAGGSSTTTHTFSSSTRGYLGARSPRQYEIVDFASDTTAISSLSGNYSYPGSSFACTSNNHFGYTGGGSGPKTTVYRLDYSTDTSATSSKGPLSVGRYWFSANGNQNFGYFNSGVTSWDSGYTSVVDRIDYGNDTATASPKGPMNVSNAYEAGLNTATGNADYSYMGGGFNKTTVNRIDYSNDTATAVVKGPLSQSSAFKASTGNSSFGYFFGGQNGPKTSVDRIDYSNDTATASPKGPLSAGRYWQGEGGMGQAKNGLSFSPYPGNIVPAPTVRDNVAPQGTDFGYFAGGYFPKTTVDRIDYTNDTATASVRGPLASATYGQGGTGSASFGYFGGGGTPGGNISTVQRIDYSNDTSNASPKGPLSASRRYISATGNSSFGYFGGGGPSPTLSTVDRVDYSNDTATAVAKGPLSVVREKVAATGNTSFGYFGGGSSKSTVDRVDYSNDTATASPKGPLSVARDSLAATGNASFGYFGGGTSKSTVDRIDYSNDTATASAKGPLSVARGLLSATGNASGGYFGGGNASGAKSTVDRIDYSNDTATASGKGPLSVARYAPTASSSRANAMPLKGPGNLEVPVAFGNFANPLPDFGYFANGSPGPGAMTTVDRIDYSNDTATAKYKSSTTATTYLSNGAASNHTHAYFMGGFTESSNISNVERMSFTNGSTMPSPKGPLVYSRRAHFGVSNLNFAYNGGGYGSAPNNAKIDRVNFSNDTSTSVEKGPLSAGGQYMSATGNNNFGYVVGSNATLVQRIDYSNDTASAPSVANLSYTKNHAAALGNADFGYFGGGNQNTTYLERIDYSSNTVTTVTSTIRSNAKDYPGSTGSSSFGYIAGGGPGTVSSIDRIDFANDTASVSPKGSLSDGRRNMRAASPKEYGHAQVQTLLQGTLATPNTGYFGGGEPGPKSTVDRIDYSNDTATAAVKGSLSAAKRRLAVISNSSFGYFGGGNLGPPGGISTVERINYLNDTVTAVAKGPLSAAKYVLTATGNADFGYFGGGAPGTYSTVDRLDYSNDTATAVARGPLSVARHRLAATGNADFGYFGGGSPGPLSTVDRLDYSNDTATAPAKGPLSAQRKELGATGNTSFGYFGGGDPGPLSTVDRIDYSNDTATAPAKGPLSAARKYLTGGATGNASFGYFSGGYTSSAVSTVDRIDYSNDTATASVKGPLSAARYSLAASSARANGFVPIGPSVVVNSTRQVLPSTWEILMFTTGNKGSSGGQGNSTEFGNTGSSTWESITASSTGAVDRTSFNDGAGLYNAFFTKTGITQIALVDGTGSLSDPTSNNNYLIYDLVGSGTGSETIYEILYRLDQYNLNNPSWAGNGGDSLFGTDSCTDFVAGTAKSGTLSAQGGSWEANNAAPAPASPSPSTTTQLHQFCIWGVNRDSDNDTQVLCAYAGNLQTGKGDTWRNNNPDETFWSYWGNDWHSNSQTQTISKGKQTDPGVVTAEPTAGVYLIAQ